MDVNNNSTTKGVLDTTIAKAYTVFFCTVTVCAMLVNVKDKILLIRRLSTCRETNTNPSRFRISFPKSVALATAILRGLSYYPLISFQCLTLTLGGFFIILVYVSVVLILSFYKFSTTDLSASNRFKDLGFRFGWISAPQLPLLFLLSQKRSFVGFLTGTSHEKLNYLHRWAARCLLLTVTLHMSYWFQHWARNNDIGGQIRRNSTAQRGLAAWCVLLWIVLSSCAPVRNWRYGFFIVQHLMTGVTFTVVVMLHMSWYANIYLWWVLLVYFLDLLGRAGYFLYHNLSIFHSQLERSRQNLTTQFLTCHARFTPLPAGAVRISISNPPFGWNPGQHAFLYNHHMINLHYRPLTIISLPSDNNLSFLVYPRSRVAGALLHTECHLPRLSGGQETVPILVGGPYGRHRPLEQFDRVILLGGEDGASFAVPLLQDLVRRWGQGGKIVTTKVTFVWTVKQRGCIAWFRETLQNLEAYMKEEQLNLSSSRGRSRFEVCMSIYVTADLTYTELETISNSDRPLSHPQCALNGHVAVAGVGVTKSNISVLGMRKGAETVVEQSEMGPHDPCSTSTTATTITGSPYSYADNNTILRSPTPIPAASVSSAPAVLPPTISVLTGHPSIYAIVKSELEQTPEEIAVVVCGPRALVNITRRAVAGLGSERMWKGGSDGIYLYTKRTYGAGAPGG